MAIPNPSLEQIMAGLAAGDEAFVCSLHEYCGAELRRALLSANRRLGLRAIDVADLDDLVWDACDVLAGVAGRWRPDGGALPWVYARRRLDRLLLDHAGPPTAPFVEPDREEVVPPVVGADDPPAIAVLDHLVRRADHPEHPVLALLQEALDRVVAKPENRELVLRYAEQLAAADRSPAHTVGALLHRPAVNVRQAFCRVRRKLVALAMADGRYRPLLTLPFLAADHGGRGFPVVAAAVAA